MAMNRGGRQEEEAAAGARGAMVPRGGKRNAPEGERGGEEGRAPGWRRPVATLAQPAADGVVTPPRLANGQRRDASRWGIGG
jgi:hypothetical protein